MKKYRIYAILLKKIKLSFLKAMILSYSSLIDDESFQHVKKIKDTEDTRDTFSLMELSLINPETEEYEVYEDTICVDEYLQTKRDELERIVTTGYKNIDDVINKYGNAAAQVMAELIFEYYGGFHANHIFAGSEDECRDFIKEYIIRLA
jgi:hypothetical protein